MLELKDISKKYASDALYRRRSIMLIWRFGITNSLRF